MDGITMEYWIGLVSVIVSVILLGVYAARKVCNAEDFSVAGGKSGPLMVMGTVVGTVVGASSTVGTAQLAFTTGISAWLFCLGAGSGLILMGIFYTNPLLDGKNITVSQVLASSYDKKTGVVASICSSAGIFFSAAASSLVLIPLLANCFSIELIYGLFLALLLVISYVFFGGAWATGLVGILKVFLLYIVLGTVFAVVITKTGGVTNVFASFSFHPWLNMFPKGIFMDVAAGFATVVGVMTTQTYMQALCSSKDKKTARNAMILSGILTILSAVPAIWVGMFMKINHPDIVPIDALTSFISIYLPSWFAGVSIGVLIIATVGSLAGLVLGIGTIVSADIVSLVIGDYWQKHKLLVTRATIFVITFIILLFTYTHMNALVLDWTVLSMCLRGSGLFIPFLMAIFKPSRFKANYAMLAIVSGTLVALLWRIFFPDLFSPLYPGMLVSSIFMLFGYKKKDLKDI